MYIVHNDHKYFKAPAANTGCFCMVPNIRLSTTTTFRRRPLFLLLFQDILFLPQVGSFFQETRHLHYLSYRQATNQQTIFFLLLFPPLVSLIWCVERDKGLKPSFHKPNTKDLTSSVGQDPNRSTVW